MKLNYVAIPYQPDNLESCNKTLEKLNYYFGKLLTRYPQRLPVNGLYCGYRERLDFLYYNSAQLILAADTFTIITEPNWSYSPLMMEEFLWAKQNNKPIEVLDYEESILK